MRLVPLKILLAVLLAPSLALGQAVAVNGATTFQIIAGWGASTGYNERNNNLTAAVADCFFSTTNGSCASGNSIGLEWVRIQDNQTASSTPDAATVILAQARGAQVLLGFNPQSAITSSNYTANANYDVAKIQYWQGQGVTINAIAPINEPVNSGTTAAAIDTFVASYLHPAMVTAGLGSIPIIIADSASWFAVTDYISTCMNDATCKADVPIVSAHAYYYGSGSQGVDGFLNGFNAAVDYAANPVPSSAAGKGIYMTELNGASQAAGACPDDTGIGAYDGSMNPDALVYAHNIHDFLTVVGGGAWMYWNLTGETANGSPLPGCNDGLTQETSTSPISSITPAKRFYAIGNWSRFLNGAGWVRISATANPQTNVYVTAFKNTNTNAFTIVAINQNTSGTSQTFNLSGLATATSVTPWLTNASNNLIQQSNITISASSFSTTLASQSVTTFVSNSTSCPPITAASCSQSAVQAAFSAVTACTSQVNIPACPSGATWLPASGTVSLVQPAGNTGLTVSGATSCTGQGNPGGSTAGVVTCTDNTLIIDGTTGGVPNGDPPLLSLTPNANTGTLRLTGLTIQGSGSTQTFNGAIVVNPGGTARIDHNHFENLNNTMMVLFSQGSSIVVDHNLLTQTTASELAHIKGATAADSGGQNPWASATAFGTESGWVYFEDNNTLGGGIDCDYGARYAARYNTMLAASGTAEFFFAHGTGEPGGAIRGCRAWELYGNFLNGNSHHFIFGGGFMESGTGLFWGNSTDSTTTLDFALILASIRRCNQSAPGGCQPTTYNQTAAPAGWGYAGTSVNGTGGPWDQNPTTTTGYRVLDQPGSGKGDLLTGSFPNLLDQATGTATWPNQALEPVYDFVNTIQPNNGYWNIEAGIPSSLTINQDYYNWCNSSAHTGCTSFNATQGVGSGNLSAMPASGTAGVGYWAQDQGTWNSSGIGGQGVLYTYKSGGSPSVYATPLAYPHPLVAGTPVAATPTASPSAGVYSSTQTVTLSDSISGATITECQDTTNTCAPTTTYTAPLTVSSTGYVRAVANATGYTQSVLASFAYTVGTTYTLSSATAGTGSGTVNCNPSGSNIAQGSSFSCSVLPNAGSIISSVTGCGGSGTSTFAGSMPASNCTVTATFEGTAAAPTFSPVSGANVPVTVTLSTATSGCAASIYWSITDNPPTLFDNNSTTAQINSASPLYAIVLGCAGWQNSPVGSASYIASILGSAHGGNAVHGGNSIHQ